MLKQLFDWTSSAVALVLLAPVFVIVSVWIKWSDAGPVFYRQQRVGRYGKPFSLLKFRSMVHDPTGLRRQVTSAHDNYITRPGAVLRKYKLDELPQLVNVLAGQMSIVGPRPEVQKYIDHYPEPDRQLVLSVKPGLTDYAAIAFRNEEQLLAGQQDPEAYYINSILPEKIALYRRYVMERSFWGDIALIMATLRAILK